MTAVTLPVIRCPVCGEEGEMLHHDIRASLVYSCQNCLHEWLIDPADGPPHVDPAVAERPQTPSRTKRHWPRRL